MEKTSQGWTLEERGRRAARVTGVGLVLNAGLTAFKYLAGFVGHSGAMVADATHSLSDLVTDVVVLLGFQVIQKPSDQGHDFGHGKVETLLALICGLFLLGAGLGICWNALWSLQKVYRGEILRAPEGVAFVAAVVSVVSKELLYWYTLYWGKRLASLALVAKAWDHRSDAFSSIGTTLGIGGAILLGEEWRVLDPLAALVVSVFVVKVSLPMIRESVNELLESSLNEEEEGRIEAILRRPAAVRDVHGLRTRKIGFYVALEAHVLMSRHLSLVEAHDVATLIEKDLRRELGEHTLASLHVEPEPPEGESHEEGHVERMVQFLE